MASEEKSFDDLVKEAPEAPCGGIISVAGVLAKASEPGKFVLTLQDGNIVTLETDAVKNHTVLGSSLGQTIVRVDIDAGKLPVRDQEFLNFRSVPAWEMSVAWLDKNVILDSIHNGDVPITGGGPIDPGFVGSLAPFALAVPHHAPATVVAAMRSLNRPTFSGWQDPHKLIPDDR